MYIILSLFLILSWFTIYSAEKRNIFVQWLNPIDRRLKEFFLGLTFAIILCFLSQILLSYLSDRTWVVSKDISVSKITFSLLYDFKSVLGEELFFRGVILYFLIKYLKAGTGILISAATFGIYHWFTFGVLGNLTAMALVFLTTGLMGYVFATSYQKTKSIMLPIGIHLGWNWINNTVYSNGPNGIQVLQPDKAMNMEGTYAIFSICLYLVIPLLILSFVRSRIIKESEVHIARI